MNRWRVPWRRTIDGLREVPHWPETQASALADRLTESAAGLSRLTRELRSHMEEGDGGT